MKLPKNKEENSEDVDFFLLENVFTDDYEDDFKQLKKFMCSFQTRQTEEREKFLQQKLSWLQREKNVSDKNFYLKRNKTISIFSKLVVETFEKNLSIFLKNFNDCHYTVTKQKPQIDKYHKVFYLRWNTFQSTFKNAGSFYSRTAGFVSFAELFSNSLLDFYRLRWVLKGFIDKVQNLFHQIGEYAKKNIDFKNLTDEEKEDCEYFLSQLSLKHLEFDTSISQFISNCQRNILNFDSFETMCTKGNSYSGSGVLRQYKKLLTDTFEDNCHNWVIQLELYFRDFIVEFANSKKPGVIEQTLMLGTFQKPSASLKQKKNSLGDTTTTNKTGVLLFYNSKFYWGATWNVEKYVVSFAKKQKLAKEEIKIIGTISNTNAEEIRKLLRYHFHVNNSCFCVPKYVIISFLKDIAEQRQSCFENNNLDT